MRAIICQRAGSRHERFHSVGFCDELDQLMRGGLRWRNSVEESAREKRASSEAVLLEQGLKEAEVVKASKQTSQGEIPFAKTWTRHLR